MNPILPYKNLPLRTLCGGADNLDSVQPYA